MTDTPDALAPRVSVSCNNDFRRRVDRCSRSVLSSTETRRLIFFGIVAGGGARPSFRARHQADGAGRDQDERGGRRGDLQDVRISLSDLYFVRFNERETGAQNCSASTLARTSGRNAGLARSVCCSTSRRPRSASSCAATRPSRSARTTSVRICYCALYPL